MKEKRKLLMELFTSNFIYQHLLWWRLCDCFLLKERFVDQPHYIDEKKMLV